MSIGSRTRAALRTVPFRYQVRGVRFIEKGGGRVLVGDDMGLGKTLQAIAWLAINPQARPAIVVCPAALKYSWQREFKKHAGLSAHVVEGRKGSLRKRDLVVINYDILSDRLATLLQFKPAVLVMDECQYVKTRTTKRTKACVKLAKKARHVLALSGTPITNRPIEFFPVLNMLRPDLFPSFWKFAMRYCGPERSPFRRGWEFNGASHVQELHERVAPLMIRRMKTEVLKDLPKKTRAVVPVEIDNRAEYRAARDNFLEWLEENGGEAAVRRAMGAVALVRLGKLKRVAALGKLTFAEKWITDFLANGHKLIVFGVHRSVLGEMFKRFRSKAVLVDGSVSGAKRQASVDRFQTDARVRLFFGQTRAAGTGLTLTAASHVLFLEVGWTPAEHDQAEDRALRIGQTADSVNVYYLVGRGTIEENIMDTIEAKRDVVGRVLDGPSSYGNLLKE